ncbi:uncharacterized protein LOC121381841 [Gigantopelta aegis]|uniref:uncharacterized protein LOC121381841 n=1 Tax=Gigantopelta aegis TaxID=1735272 RepID=UPI001B88A16E|nr:uncharacterized protein LOC121381841 [Gigantopelta aegis]
MQEQSTMEVDRLSHHPCHRLSVPAAKLFWCRHCMEKFEDPISRWRHSKTCKTEGTLNMNKRKEQEAEAFKLFVESTTEPEQETELESSLQLTAATVSPPEKIPSVTQQTGTDLNCFICKKEFMSLDEMRAHVRTPCNKQDKHSEVYSRFPFITDSFKNSHMESADQLHVHDELDSLLTLHNTEKQPNKEEMIIAKLLSQWSQQKVSYKQPNKEMKHKSPLLKNSTITSEQSLNYMQAQSTVVLDTMTEGHCFSQKTVIETCSHDEQIFIGHKTSNGNMSMKSSEVEVLEDVAQQDCNDQSHKHLEKHWNSEAVLKSGVTNELPDRKRKCIDQNFDSVVKRQRVDDLMSKDETCTKIFNNSEIDIKASQKKENEDSQNVGCEAGKGVGVKKPTFQDALEMRRDCDKDGILHVSGDNNTVSVVNGDCVSTKHSPANITDVSKPGNDHYATTDSFIVRQSFEQSDKENHASVDVCPLVTKDEKDSVSVKCFRPVRTIPSAVSSVITCDYTLDQIVSMESSPEKDFTVLREPETLLAGKQNLENKSPMAKICSSRKYKSIKVSKNKPKPVRAVIPVVNTGLRNTNHDDSDTDCIETVESKYITHSPSPAKTRSKLKDPAFCSVRSTARTLKPTQKKLELMVEQKSRSKVQPKGKTQSATKDQITNKKSVKKSVKVSEKQTAKKNSAGKESKLREKKPKPEKTVMFHQLKTEKSKSKPPKNLKCRLCDRIFDSVKQYQNHTRIPCKMKITRKWSQKVLRPNRSLPPSWKPRPGKRKNKDVKKPNLIPNNFRIHSQWEPSKRIRKTSKTKTRPASPQLSIVESSKEKRPLPHQQVEVSDLTEKELFLFKLNLMCSDDLPLYMCVRPRVQYMPHPLAVSVDNAISDNLSDCYTSPPVLERIDIDVVMAAIGSTDYPSNLEPPHLIPAVLYNEVLQANESHSKTNLPSGHDLAMNNVKTDMKLNHHRNIFDMISVVKNSASDISDCSSLSPIKNDKETLIGSSRCKAFNSPNNSQKLLPVSYTDSDGCNVLLNTKPSLCIGKEYYSSTKPSDVDLVISPQRKEKRNLFETLGWEMLSENSDLSISKTEPTCLPQRLAEQTDKDIIGFLSKGLGIETSNDTTASPVKDAKKYDNQWFSSNKSVCPLKMQSKFVQQPVTQLSVIKPLKTKLLLTSSSVSSVSQSSPNSSHQLSPGHHSPVLIPSPRRPTVTKHGRSATHLYSSSVRCIMPQDHSEVAVTSSPSNIPTKELTNDTEKCNQEPLSDVMILESIVTNVSHIVRKLQFNSCHEYTNTCNISDTELVSSEASSKDTQREESPCDTLSSNNDVQPDDDFHQNMVQIHVLHSDESESSDVEDLLADIVQRICSDPSRGQSSVSSRNNQCNCQNAVISLENRKDVSLCSCAQSKCLSNKSNSISSRESSSGSGVSSALTSSVVIDKGPSVYKVNTENSFDETNEENCIGDSDEVHALELEDTSDEVVAEEQKGPSENIGDHVSPDVTVEYVDHITSEMLDDSHVTYIIIEQDDVRKYIDSIKDITSAEDNVTTSSFVSVS